MAGTKGFAAVAKLARRTQAQRGGNERTPDHFDRSAPTRSPCGVTATLNRWRPQLRRRHAARPARCVESFFGVGSGARPDARRPDHAPDFGKLSALALALHQGQRPAAWLEHARNRLGTLKDFFRWVTRQDVILHNPASEVELPRMEKRLPQAVLTLARSRATAGRARRERSARHARSRHARTLLLDGIRRTELCRLELADLNTERLTLHVRLGKGKKDRVVPVGRQAIVWLEHYLQEVRPRLCLDTRTQALFLTGYGEDFNPDVVSRMVAAWLKKVPG